MSNRTLELPSGKHIQLLSSEEAKHAIVCDDQKSFFEYLTKMDIKLRLKRNLGDNHSENLKSLKDFIRGSVRDFDESETRHITELLKEINQIIEPNYPNFIPSVWKFIKTTGEEEGNAFYTRDDFIIIPASRFNEMIKIDRKKLIHILIHETFHIYSRLHKELRSKFYSTIGFRKVQSISLGTFLSERRITNPDAPEYNYIIDIKYKGKKIDVVPITYSTSKNYPLNKKLSMFDLVGFGLFEVYESAEDYYVREKNELPLYHSPNDVKGYFEKIGRNTPYIIHPEEIIAENVTLIVMLNARLIKEHYNMNLLKKVQDVLKNASMQD